MVETTDQTWLEVAFSRRFVPWAQRVRLTGKLAIGLALATAASGVATYTAWTGTAPQTPNPRLVLGLLVVDLVLVLSLGALIARQLVRLWVARRSGSAGSRLHGRFVALFSLVAVTPAIIVALFSAVFFYLGVQSWFSERVRTAVGGSLAVAEAYMQEHRHTIRADILAMANVVDRLDPRLRDKPAALSRLLAIQAARHSLSQATVFDGSGNIKGQTYLSFSSAFDDPPLDRIAQASRSDPLIFTGGADDEVRALIRLDSFLDAYLYVSRFVDPVVLSYVERTRAVVSEYEALEGARSDIQLTSALIFIVVALMLLLAAIWLGLTFANRLVGPIRGLMMAAERVRDGDLSARVPEGDAGDEIGSLSRAFNRMTGQLAAQREELVEANRQMDRRRRFTEAVLSGVSAGVVGLDGDGVINLPNRSAAELLETGPENLIGSRFAEAVPEMAALLAQARQRPDHIVEGQISLVRKGHRRTFMVRVSTDRTQHDRFGYVVTFDDVTELVTAQRTAAWADIARRIAHEIKNPLTPIQLSAERLKRKYLAQIKIEPDVFTQCTDTIIRQVGDIGRMVDEFSAFARMPAAEMKNNDLCEIARDAVFAEQIAHGDVDYQIDLPEAPLVIRCDAQHVGRALTNLLRNAEEAIDGRPAAAGEAKPGGLIRVLVRRDGRRVSLEVRDNGRGLPAEGRERLTEPYVTLRDKGTGLGLAIVQKIAEEHGARLYLEDDEGGGACARLTFEIAAGGRAKTVADDVTEQGGVSSYGA
ncbi:MAG: PAS domain-containing sensor histidine kinase [Alphaproteobacteria bacterium]|nr:PAS domain-containing sensor histidine kinase [Alphaproteobacteria bacterium]